jgi:hypothetical protein
VFDVTDYFRQLYKESPETAEALLAAYESEGMPGFGTTFNKLDREEKAKATMLYMGLMNRKPKIVDVTPQAQNQDVIYPEAQRMFPDVIDVEGGLTGPLGPRAPMGNIFY